MMAGNLPLAGQIQVLFNRWFSSGRDPPPSAKTLILLAFPRGLFGPSSVNRLRESGTAIVSMMFQGFCGLVSHRNYRAIAPLQRAGEAASAPLSK